VPENWSLPHIVNGILRLSDCRRYLSNLYRLDNPPYQIVGHHLCWLGDLNQVLTPSTPKKVQFNSIMDLHYRKEGHPL
jgi:hypothetical protein